MDQKDIFDSNIPVHGRVSDFPNTNSSVAYGSGLDSIPNSSTSSFQSISEPHPAAPSYFTPKQLKDYKLGPLKGSHAGWNRLQEMVTPSGGQIPAKLKRAPMLL